MKRIFTLLFIGALFFSCSDDDTNCCMPVPECGKFPFTTNDKVFAEIATDNYSITHVVLSGNCLDITIHSGGCDGNTWEESLFSVISFVEIDTHQKALKLKLINQELCLAIVEKTISFDLTLLQIEELNQIVFLLEGWDEPIIYQY